MIKLRFGQSIFSNLLTVFLLVVMPIYLGGFLVYDWGVRQVKSEISRSIEAKNRYVIEAMDSELRGMRNHLSSLLNNRDVRLLAFSGNRMPEIDRVFAIRQVQDHLRLFMVSSQYVSNITLHVPVIERSVHALGGITPLSPEQYQELDETATQAVGQIILSEGSLPSLYLAYPQQYIARARQSSYMLEIVFSQDALARNLAIMADNSYLALFSDRFDVLLAVTDAQADPASYFRSFYASTATAERQTRFSGQMDYADETYLVTIDYQPATELLLVGYIPLRQIYQPLLRYQPLFWSFTAVVVMLAILFFYLLYRLLHRPLRQFVAAFRYVENGRFDLQLKHRHRDEFHELYTGFNDMVAKLHRLVDQVYRQTIYAQQAELKQLQSQISPHFLYNSFFVLQNMADNGETEELSAYAGLMGRYFQYITRNEKPDATLTEEVAHARIYATMQARRFRNRLSLVFDPLPDVIADCLIPRLTLQPLLENAFEHGLKNKTADGRLVVRFVDQADRLEIVVADNGDDLTPEEMNGLRQMLAQPADTVVSTGLLNVHRRLQLRFGPAYGLILSCTDGGGLTVCLCIPRRTSKD